MAVLDGGLAAWTRAGLPLSDDGEHWAPARFTPRVDATARVAVGEVLPHVEQPGHVLVDARAADRFRGQNETLDPVAGHIPGAVNRFFQAEPHRREDLQDARGAARRVERRCSAGPGPASVVMYCGSGVTACHNLLALEHAGLSGARLFAGSWSEWCADPSRPSPPATDPPQELSADSPTGSRSSPESRARVPPNVSSSPFVQPPDVASGRRRHDPST